MFSLSVSFRSLRKASHKRPPLTAVPGPPQLTWKGRSLPASLWGRGVGKEEATPSKHRGSGLVDSLQTHPPVASPWCPRARPRPARTLASPDGHRRWLRPPPERGNREILSPTHGALAVPGSPAPKAPERPRAVPTAPRTQENYDSRHASGPAPTTLPRGRRWRRPLPRGESSRLWGAFGPTLSAGAALRGSVHGTNEGGGLLQELVA